MDDNLNKKIIFGVRKKACLYKSSNIKERNEAWKQLSDELVMDEQLLKIRWHLLLKRYQANEYFKYGQFMDFVERKNETQISKWPEFEITEDDVAEWRSNKEENMFLEVEDVDNTIEPADKCNVTKSSDDGKGKEFNQSSDNSVAVHNQAKEQNANSAGASEKRPEEMCRESNPNSKSGETSSAPASSTSERCEDVIFGELVTAMLKRMDEDKKRNIKKEIMNLLLT
ncbi:uncharacterized protein isoform X1 [Musca autumnalis]|uniref:uncharacterized protein isoform X1 n=1 Tax=Musca autumnalis TaxID=221902 RepID=UPI003CFA2E46